MNKRGFTLMEVLAVLMLLAVVASLSIPGIRAVRYEIKNGQAKVAAKKMVEGIKYFRQMTRGGTVNSFGSDGFDPNSLENIEEEECEGGMNTGIPGREISVGIRQLFACGYLSPKDFRGVPYKFYYVAIPSSPDAPAIPADKQQGDIVLMVLGQDGAGPRYAHDKYAIYIDDRMEPIEYEVED